MDYLHVSMPSTRQISKGESFPSYTKSQNQFVFPDNQHLLVATASRIFAWDSTGVQTVFKSSKSAIVAVKEAKDGSGILAIADRHVVVLHDTKRGQERSWGLRADEDEVRHLEYTKDAKSLYVSTKLTPDIQRYSTERSRLLTPSKAHASSPVALAVSPSGDLMVSASDDPLVVCLKNIAVNSTPVTLQIDASNAGVSVIAFHPERPNVFLLAFRDGTLSAFDAARIARASTESLSGHQRANQGQIGQLKKLHRITVDGRKSTSITGAAFLPGYKTRAVSVGADGRCRLIDFGGGGTILRTWHVKAPATSVSVASLKGESGDILETGSHRSSNSVSDPSSRHIVIAVGREDGKIQLYDSVGLMLSQKSVGVNGERIISVEWAKGPSPKPIKDTSQAKSLSDPPSLSLDNGAMTGPRKTTLKSQKTTAATVHDVAGAGTPGQTSAGASSQPTTGAIRKFTIHPDEIAESTVRHTPSPQKKFRPQIPNGQYLDLFSPVKENQEAKESVQEQRIISSPRSRPRISSQTFLKSPEATRADAGRDPTTAKPRNLALFPSTDSGSGNARLEKIFPHSTDLDRPSDADPPPLSARHIVSFKAPPAKRRRTSPVKAQTVVNHSATVLANLRQMSATHPAERTGGVLSRYARSRPEAAIQQSQPSCGRRGPHMLHRPVDHVEVTLDSENAHRAYDEAHKRLIWPDDSIQDSSLGEDIWMTSDTDTTVRRSRKRRKLPILRPPGRQTSRSRMGDTGTVTTTKSAIPPTQTALPFIRPDLDGSTGEDLPMTSQTHVSQDGTFFPSSNDVRKLFPRSSSLSPRRKHKSSPHRLQRSGHINERVLREIANNTVQLSPRKDSKKKKRSSKPVEKLGSPKRDAQKTLQMLHDGANDQVNCSRNALTTCEKCSHNEERMHDLETQVASLKGEALMLKAMLRRSGVPVPYMTKFAERV